MQEDTLRNARILIVDDQDADVRLLRGILKRAGADSSNLRSTTDPLKVVPYFAEFDPDLIILDLHMPGMDGFAVMKELRPLIPAGTYFPILVNTADITPEAKQRALLGGAKDFLTKPLDTTEVVLRIANLLETRNLHLALRDQNQTLEAKVRARTRDLAEALTERKQTEEALERFGRRIELILNAAGEGIYGLDLDGNATFVNPAAASMLGWDVKELLGQPVHGMLHHSKPDGTPYPREECPIYAAFREGVVRHVDDEVFWRKDGTSFPVEYTSTPIRERGELVGAVVVFKDITQPKQFEEARLAKKAADEANRAKSEFLSRMSHELRTPLNAILGFGQLLEMDSLNPEQREGVEHILKAGRHLLELINEVLDIACIEAGRLAISLEPVPLNDVVQETLDLITPLAVETDVQIHAEAAGTSDWHILADRQRLKQVLLNLLANAVKYNRKGGFVALSYEGSQEGRLRVKVTDTGPGIPAERIERLFTPFERLGAEQTGIEGTGLGLALSKRLVGAMGGTLGVESTVGRGSTFWVEFALVEAPVQRLKRTGKHVPAPAELEASKKARVVLYVEDNLSNIKLIQRLLAHRPEVRLLPAMQGLMGLDLARKHRPHLILLDLHLPDMQGDEVLRRLRQAPETSQIPVVVISADATPAQIERLLAAGARAYLTKPLDVKKLLDLLDEILQEREPGRVGRDH